MTNLVSNIASQTSSQTASSEPLLATGNPKSGTVTIGGSVFVNTKKAADFCGLTYESIKTYRAMDRKRHKSGEPLRGPAWVKVASSGKIFYSVQVMTQWLEGRSAHNPSAVMELG
jgi:hypothetical protein